MVWTILCWWLPEQMVKHRLSLSSPISDAYAMIVTGMLPMWIPPHGPRRTTYELLNKSSKASELLPQHA